MSRSLAGLVVAACLFAGNQGWAYDYPIPEPFTATVVGVPVPQMRAQIPAVKLRTGQLKPTVDRDIPKALWFNARMPYLYRMQRKPAPLAFIIAGTGGGYNTAKNRELMSLLWNAGISVVGLASPTHGTFITPAGSTGVPGNLGIDAQDLYAVMQAIVDELDPRRKKITDFYMTGYSLGGSHAAYVARLDKEEQKLGFSKVLLINPTVSLYNSVSRLDRMIESVPGGIDNFPAFFNDLVAKVSDAYKKSDTVALDETLFFQVFQADPPGPDDLAAIVGAAFRIAAANLFVASDIIAREGFAIPANATATGTSSLTEFFKVHLRTGFTDYYHEVYFPFYQRQRPSLTREELAELQSLSAIQGFLGEADYIGVVHNRDDIILAPGEIDFFEATFEDRAIIYPYGGHMGNFSHYENIGNVLAFFTEGWK
jgi:hypothetical protein